MKLYTVTAAILATSVLLPGLGISQTANADLPEPRVYKVPTDRTDKTNHRDAMLIVVARKWGGKTTHQLLFLPKRGKFKNQPFLCGKAKADDSDETLSCTQEVEYGKWKVRETLTVGNLGEKFCADLGDRLTKGGHPKAVMKKGDCGAKKDCVCYELAQVCLDQSDNKYKNICPEFDDEKSYAKVDFNLMVPPGRGAGSGRSN